MARRDQTKSERKQARAQAKAERRQARAGRKRRAAPGVAAVPDVPGEDASPDDRIEWRLARLEEAVATQSERSEELLRKVDSMLQESRAAAAQPTPGGAGAGGDGD